MDSTLQDITSSAEHQNSKMSDFEQQKVLKYLKIVHWVTARMLGRLPRHIDSEDLISSGMLGLIDAVRRFSWGRENEEEEFKAYAECRVRGQIIDDLRRSDVLPRSARDKVNRLKKAYEALRQELKTEPSDKQLCDYLKIDLETCHQLKSQIYYGSEVSFDACQMRQTMEGMLAKSLPRVSDESPEAVVHRQEIKRHLAEAIDRLEEREKHIISLYYLEEMTLKEIGSILSITESRVSQIHAMVMVKLLKRLRNALEMDFPFNGSF